MSAYLLLLIFICKKTGQTNLKSFKKSLYDTSSLFENGDLHSF